MPEGSSPMSRLKIGVIGCGAIGKDHIRRLHNLVPEADVGGK